MPRQSRECQHPTQSCAARLKPAKIEHVHIALLERLCLAIDGDIGQEGLDRFFGCHAAILDLFIHDQAALRNRWLS
jgi:hypothetical protein